jgi:hypothetical protein
MSMELLDNIRAVNTGHRLAHTLRNEVAYRDSESLTELNAIIEKIKL